MMGREGVPAAVASKRAEIDTTAPFKSVREAVSLFGERVLAGELRATRINQMRGGGTDQYGCGAIAKLGNVTAELEEMKESLRRAREEGLVMATNLSSLREELEKAKRELEQLKERESSEKRVVETTDLEDVKVVEDWKKFEDDPEKNSSGEEFEEMSREFQKKRYVTFANSPSLTRMMTPQDPNQVLEKHSSLRKKKKKPLIPLFGGLFSKRKTGVCSEATMDEP